MIVKITYKLKLLQCFQLNTRRCYLSQNHTKQLYNSNQLKTQKTEKVE